MPKVSRRAFLKLAGPLPLLPVVMRHKQLLGAGRSNAPNVLVVVFDTLSAGNLSLYGYERRTTPHLARIAERATVFHNHYAGGNFTTPGTASLLTGTYPWSHRAFNFRARVDNRYRDKNLFRAFASAGYYRMAYTHNPLVDYFLYQFRDALDSYLGRETFYLASNPINQLVPRGDQDVGRRSEEFLINRTGQQTRPGSLLLSLLVRLGYKQYKQLELEPAWDQRFPEGLPAYNGDRSVFLLEQAMDGIHALSQAAPQPFLGYFHLLPPHDPYNPRREFVDLFRGSGSPAAKPEHRFTRHRTQAFLNEKRQRYDEYIAYVDAEFGRLHDRLAQSGQLDNTYLVLTSDHGELFERGIWGHGVRVLYEPLIRVPLIIVKPGQTKREDVHTPTSCVDLLPTLLHAAGQPVPAWCEGQVLPTFDGASPEAERSLFAVEAKRNSKYAALTRAIVAMRKGRYKLVHTFGYQGYSDSYELYDLVSDPEELHNLTATHAEVTAEMQAALAAKLLAVNQPYLG